MANSAQQNLILFFLSSVVLSPKPVAKSQKNGKRDEQHNLDVEDVMELMAQKAKNVDSTVKPLSFKWTMFHDKKMKSSAVMSQKDYLDTLETIGTFSTFPDFWSCWKKVQETFPSSTSKTEFTYRLFKDGITPSWEDPANVKGGKFTIKMDRIRSIDLLQKSWLSLIIALLIGELGHENTMCGAVLSIRPWGTLLSVWNNDAKDKAKIRAVTQRLRELFGTSDIKYAPHQNSINKLQKKSGKSETESSEDEAGTSQQMKKNYNSYLSALLATQVVHQEKVNAEKVIMETPRNEEPQTPSLEVKESVQTVETKELRSQTSDSEEESTSETESASVSNESVPVVAEVAPIEEKVEQRVEVPQVSTAEAKKKKRALKRKIAKSKVAAVVAVQEQKVAVVQTPVEEKASWWKVGLAATAASVVSLASAILLYTSA